MDFYSLLDTWFQEAYSSYPILEFVVINQWEAQVRCKPCNEFIYLKWYYENQTFHCGGVPYDIYSPDFNFDIAFKSLMDHLWHHQLGSKYIETHGTTTHSQHGKK